MHFVLLHGAWHGGWAWDGVTAELEKAGHTAEAPTMPGHHPDDDRSGIQLSDYVDAISGVLEKQSEPVVLVGHSSGGYMIQAAAPKASDKVAHMIFLNAFILPNGTSQFDLVPPEAAEGMTAAAQASPDLCVPVIEDFVRNTLMNGESIEDQDALLERLLPQPLALFTTGFDTAPFDALDIPRSVVFCTRDVSMPPGGYLAMAEGLGDYKLVEIEGSHEALYADPATVAAGILEAVE